MAHTDINILVSHPARLIYVGTPKCGSSTVVAAFLQMHGIASPPRKERTVARKAVADGRLAAAGMQFHRTFARDIAPIRDRYPDYTLFASVRDPYSRLVSAYFNKLNRYTKAYMKPVYLRGKLVQFLSGPGKWDRVEVGNKVAHKALPFAAFLTPENRARIAKLYATDFERLGYPV